MSYEQATAARESPNSAKVRQEQKAVLIVTVGEKTLLTSAYLKPGKQVSTYCQSTLEPHQAP